MRRAVIVHFTVVRVARRFTAEAFNQLFEFPHFLAGLFGSQGAAPEFRLLVHVSASTKDHTKAPAPMPENESDRQKNQCASS